MNRISGRSWIVMIIALLLIGGLTFFIVEFCLESGQWVVHSGSPHVYSSDGKTVDAMVVIDRQDTILLDTREGTVYSNDGAIRTATVHWVGDRGGNINVRTLSRFTDQIAQLRLDEYNVLTGVYTYGDYTSVAELTIDARLQTAALAALGDYSGTVAVYNYQTGELLCAVSSPSFDPDDLPEELADGSYYNKFLDEHYAPGSIFKIVTLAAALETMQDAESWTYTCGSVHELPGYDVSCETAHGAQTLKEAFCNSCNCAFAALSLELGADVMAYYVEAFGVADSVTVDGITTASGNYSVGTDTSDLAWSAVGQYEDLINPCSFLTFVGAIAGDGEAVMPYIVEEITVRDSAIYSAQTESAERIMSEKTARILQEYMRNNVANKYGDENFPGLTVCAKTGTAEVGSEGDDIAPNAMLAGFVSDDRYPLAFIICVEDGGYGSKICVPIASQVLAACKDVMDDA